MIGEFREGFREGTSGLGFKRDHNREFAGESARFLRQDFQANLGAEEEGMSRGRRDGIEHQVASPMLLRDGVAQLAREEHAVGVPPSAGRWRLGIAHAAIMDTHGTYYERR